MKFKTTLAIAAAGLFGLAAVNTAHADALATSILDMTNLKFVSVNTGIALDAGDFAAITFSGGASAKADLGSASESHSGQSNSGSPIDLPGGAGGLPGAGIIASSPVGNDLCIGACPGAIVANAFNMLTSPPAATYAAADQNEVGSPVTGFGPTPFVADADVGQASYVSLIGPNQAGTANAENNISSSFVFTLIDATAVDIVFDARAYLEAFVSSVPPEAFPASAKSGYTFQVTVTDAAGTPVVEWKPDGALNGGGSTELGITETSDPFSLNQNRSADAPIFNGFCIFAGAACGVENVGSFAGTTIVFAAGTPYQLSMSMTSTATALTRIPEPATLALLGLGLLGMVAARRRRN